MLLQTDRKAEQLQNEKIENRKKLLLKEAINDYLVKNFFINFFFLYSLS